MHEFSLQFYFSDSRKLHKVLSGGRAPLYEFSRSFHSQVSRGQEAYSNDRWLISPYFIRQEN